MDPINTHSRAAWRLHLGLLVWIGAVLIVSLSTSTDEQELWGSWRSGNVEDQLGGLQALVQRGQSDELGEHFPRALLAASDPRLREVAFTSLFTRRPETRVTPDDLREVQDPRERARAQLWLLKQMTTPGRFGLPQLDQWFEELAP